MSGIFDKAAPRPPRGADAQPIAAEPPAHAADSAVLADEAGDDAIATMREGDSVDAVLACTRKERQMSRAGTPYLTVELRDRSGAIQGRAFRDADLFAGRFERGDMVRVQGQVERFRGDLQLAIETIERIQFDDDQAARFLPTSHRDIDELEGFFEHLSREVYDPAFKGLLDAILADEKLRAELRRAPCSLPASATSKAQAHHAFLGGLIEHTVGVATMAVELCTVHPRLDRDLLLCAALVHDIGKTREYSYGAEIARTEEGALLGHVELGLRILAAHAPAALSGKRRLALEHCVLSHHGGDPGAGGRGQRPATAEALALARLNSLDASVKGAFERGLGI